MADSKLSDLSAAASLASTDLFYVVKTAGSGGVKATLSQLNTLYAGLGANTFTSLQTITVGAANTGVLASTGYSLTGSDATPMVNLAGTWNTSGTPTAIKLNVTDTASNASSLLLDLQVGSASKFRITKAGYIQFIAGSSSPSMGPVGTSLTSLGVFNAALSDYADLWTSSNYVKGALSVNDHLSIGTTHGTDGDTRLYRDAAYALAQRNSTNAQTLRVYNTYTDASNYERGVFDWTTNSNVLTIGTQKLGTGAIRPISFVIGGTEIAYFTTSSITLNGDIGVGSTSQLQWTSKGKIYATSDGSFVMWDSSQTTFGQLKFGGTTSSFPALKRSSTSLQVRLADDSADAPISASYVKTPGVAVASLPSASTAGAGARSFVTDATATTFATTVAGGGANKVPVVSDGTNWIIG